DAGIARERAGERHALTLAARELARVAPAKARELHQPKQFLDAFADRIARWTGAAAHDAEPEGDVLRDRHVAEQSIMLKDETDAARRRLVSGYIPAAEPDLALLGRLQTGEDAEQGCLARTRRAEQRDEF